MKRMSHVSCKWGVLQIGFTADQSDEALQIHRKMNSMFENLGV